MSPPKPMQACEDCGLLFRDSRGVSEHMATNHLPGSGDEMDQPGYWDAMQPGDPRRSVRRKYKVVRPDYDSMTYVEVTDDE